MRRALAAVALLSGCTESGPSAEQLAEAARLKACAGAAARVSAALKAAAELDALPLAEVKHDAPLPRPLELRTRTQLEACAAKLSACDAEPQGCAEVGGYLLVRPSVDERVQVNEAMLNKYTGGRQAGAAYAFELKGRRALAAVTFDVKLHGGVDVERDATTAEREQALNDALARQVREAIDAKLKGPALR